MPTTYSPWFRLRVATKAALAEFRRVYQSPQERVEGAFENRARLYTTLWDYYTNEVFEQKAGQVDTWQHYRQRYGLYRHIRSIYNPVPRLVDFYAAVVYPGLWAAPSVNLPEGTPRAFEPVFDSEDDKSKQLSEAIFQLIQWSNWQAMSKVMIRYAAATGNCLVELKDEVERGRVSFDARWPGLVADMQLDSSANVRAYALEYDAIDEMGLTYRYRKEVTPDWIVTYRNDEQHGFDGMDAEIPNPYGFCPAVWVKHIDLGDEFGAPALRAGMGKIDELNSLVSHLHDYTHKAIRSPRILWTSGMISSAFDSDLNTNDLSDESEGGLDTDSDIDRYDILKGPENGRSDSLLGDLSLDDALQAASNLMSEIESDYPELSFWSELRKLTQNLAVARMLTGDTALRVFESATNYDLATKSLLQMGTAIGGLRYEQRAGGWAVRNAKRDKFKGYSLDSYKRDELEFEVKPRLLIPESETERLESMKARADYAQKIQDIVGDDETLRVLGYSDEEIARVKRERATTGAIPAEGY